MIGVTGGIAAYKTAELVRLLVKDAVAVDVVMTQAGARFVTPTTFQALSGRPVLTDLWASGSDNAMGHIALSRGADAILVAPASADFLAKLAKRPRGRPALHTLPRARMPAAGRPGDERADVEPRGHAAQCRAAGAPTA